MSKKNKNLKRQFRSAKKMGAAPGTITYMGSRTDSKFVVTVAEYDKDNLHLSQLKDVQGIGRYTRTPEITWMNIVGLTDEAKIGVIGKEFGFNPLILEDAVNTHSRPKIDEYEDYIFGVFKMMYIDTNNELVIEHTAVILCKNAVLVLQELEYDVFGGVRERMGNKLGRIRNNGPDYLFFALIDSIIDNYYAVLENIYDQLEALEEEVYYDPTPETAHNIQQLKKEVMGVRKWAFPVKELIGKLIDSESPLITKETKLYLRDVLDHCNEINENLQLYREMSTSLMELYMTNVSNKMNEVMKVLTIMASIFIPLTFIAGVYGMNFDFMPELHWKYGYFMVLGVMLLLFIGMMLYFKRKKWL
ncbi:magnesium/cobalt transporter CorA [Flavobacteriaceae bacterium F89]|uniref:Magnesium transport protein CorA n=1 Tax=Cerina litoralis TaxID=2874477 RepID=A0AAE3JNU2_9FLAO|nr:magnesium/cobalt transporter CorA [Cerina litoralis]MCG2461400.1 magnesium/cobalt transporter CorA [Cerina litoralis]